MKQQQEIDSVPPTPGSLLKSTRQENGWSVEEIAKALRMSTTQVKAIEEDDTEQLHGITYIRGYWVNYARLLDIDIESSIEYHKSRLLDPPSMMANPKLHSMPSSNERKKKQAALLFGVLAIIGCVALYFLQPKQNSRSVRVFENPLQSNSAAPVREEAGDGLLQSQDSDNFAMLNESNDDEVVQEHPEVNSADISSHLGNQVQASQLTDINANNLANEVDASLDQAHISETQEAPEMVENAANLDIIEENEQQSNENKSSVADSVAIQQETLDEPRQEITTDKPSELSKDINVPEVTDATDSAQLKQADEPQLEDGQEENSAELEAPISQSQIISRTSADSPDTVVFYNSQTSWFDVRDANGNILVYEDIAANQVLSLKGRPPFYVYSTNAQTLTIAYMGEVFPHQSQISDNSIRLKISQ